MGPRRCSNVHFINAISGDAIIKKRNVSASGKKSLLFRTVDNILEKGDAGWAHRSTYSLQQPCLKAKGSIIEKQLIVLPVVDRSLQELETREKEHGCLVAANEIGGNSGEDSDGDMTLKQLKQQSKTKKRKRVNSVKSTCTEQVCVKLEPVEEDPDLYKPIISLKSKLPKAKRKCVQSVSKSPEVGLSSNTRKDVDNDKTEVPEPDITPLLDDPKIINLKDTITTEVIPNQNLDTIESENTTLLSFSVGYGSCALNQISYDHSNNVKPSSQTMDPSYVETSFQHLHDYPTLEIETQGNTEPSLKSDSPTKNQSSEINESSSINVSSHGLMEISCNISTVIEVVPNLRADNCTNSNDLNLRATFSPDQQPKGPNCPVSGLSSSENHYPCSVTDENFFPTGTRNCASSLVVSSEECSLNEEDNSLGEERNSYPTSVDNEHTSAHVSAPPPERLHLTRKVISPSSQERISLAMNSKESHDENDCKENTSLMKKDSDEPLLVSETTQDSSPVKQKRGTPSPCILKKPKNGKRRNSLPKGNLEGPRLSRTLQNFSTGCSSLKKCSESAIAFSKRQMQDIESLAINLIGELESMKDVMEGKFVSEVRQTSDLKREAEEVKEAIKHATKTEETTRKWLSIMGRDCNRFCKIMSMKQSDGDDNNNNVGQREEKKIVFADEAGGSLCHVKYFENDMKLKTDIKQEDETQ